MTIKDKMEIGWIKFRIKLRRFFKRKFWRGVWHVVSSLLLLLLAGGIGVFAAFAQTEGAAEVYAREYFGYFMTRNWDEMYATTDLPNSAFINVESFGKMMSLIVPQRGVDYSEFQDRGTDGKYHIIDVIYQESGSEEKQTMTLRMKKKKEKKLFLLNQWEVSLKDDILKQCKIRVPAGLQISFNGQDLSILEYEEEADTGFRIYTLDKVLAGRHGITVSAVETETVSESFVWDTSLSSYTVQTTDFTLTDNIVVTCSDQSIDMVVAMYLAVLTDAGTDSIKSYFSTEEEKTAIDVLYQTLMSQINKEDGSTLETMSFDSYDTEMIDYSYNKSFGIKFTFGTTFSAKGPKNLISVRKSYDGTAQGEAVVRFTCREGKWLPAGIEMNCFDYSEKEE